MLPSPAIALLESGKNCRLVASDGFLHIRGYRRHYAPFSRSVIDGAVDDGDR